jgi:hypothetical protein
MRAARADWCSRRHASPSAESGGEGALTMSTAVTRGEDDFVAVGMWGFRSTATEARGER